jgi:hypothetical protein
MKVTTLATSVPYLLVVGLMLFLRPLPILAAGETKLMLDDMSQFFEGTSYPSSLYEELAACMQQWGVQRLEESQDAAWKGFYDFYLAGGAAGDAWGNYTNEYMESKLNRTALFGADGRTYEVQEKCNYVSNVAFYRSAVRVCHYQQWKIPVADRVALMQSFVSAGTASAWFHGSMTETGRQYDGYLVAVLIYNAYQIAIRSTGTNSTILLTVSDSIQPTPISVMANQVSYMPLNYSVSEWVSFLQSLQVERRYTVVVVALITFSCAAVSPFFICERLVRDVIAPELLSDDETEFMINKYIPEMKLLVEAEEFPLHPWEGVPVFVKITGVSIALLWAFAFQETVLPTPCLEGDFFNLTRLGAMKSPLIDVLAFFMHGVKNTDDRGFWDGRQSHPYPGSDFCNTNSPHALWHERAADGLVELYAIADEVEQILQKRNKRRRVQQVAEEKGIQQSAFRGIRLS